MSEDFVVSMDLLDRLLEHDSWTTRQFLDLAKRLTRDQLDSNCGIGHGTVRKTFEHIIWNVECWTDLMNGDAVRLRPAGHQSIDDLIVRFDAASSKFVQFAREVSAGDRLAEQFVDTLDDPPRQKSLGTAIVHVVTHGMHHRAQLLIMYRRLGYSNLPEGDALSWELALNDERS